jgi:acyl-CoA reductase-like NAD-dependent aldehyde dehydrogenase
LAAVDTDADLQDATERLVFGAFYQSGQSCIGVQRILVHDSIYDELRDRLIESTNALAALILQADSSFAPRHYQRSLNKLVSWGQTQQVPVAQLDRVSASEEHLEFPKSHVKHLFL